MRIRELSIIGFAFLLFVTSASVAADNPKNKSCKNHPKLSGPCFKLRGRMAFYNGNPSVRIWPVGTNRILGIDEGPFYLEGYDNVPEELVRQMTTFDTVMFGDFVVCPFADDEPGVMRPICVESAENISIGKRE